MTATAVVARWTGAEADALRQSLRMSQEKFAEHLGMAARSVANWRARPARPVSTSTAQLLDTVWSRADVSTRARFADLTDTVTPVAAPTDLRAELAELATQVDRLTALVTHLTPA